MITLSVKINHILYAVLDVQPIFSISLGIRSGEGQGLHHITNDTRSPFKYVAKSSVTITLSSLSPFILDKNDVLTIEPLEENDDTSI